MMMQVETIIFSVMLLIVGITSNQDLACSGVFTYDSENLYEKQYFGSIHLRSEAAALHNLEIDIVFDKEIVLFVNYFGYSSTQDNKEFKIVKSGFTLYPGHTVRIRIEVTYRGRTKPLVEEIKLNRVIICPDPVASSMAKFHTLQFSRRNLNTEMPRNFTNNMNNKFNSSCSALNSDISVSPGRWDGIINLVADTTSYGINIEIIFDKAVQVFGNHFGQVTSSNDTIFIINNSSATLRAESELQLEFFVKYSELERIPDVREILFNGKEICRKDQRTRRIPTVTAPPYILRNISFNDDNRLDEPSTTEAYEGTEDDYDESICATSTAFAVSSRIIGGSGANVGDFPWHVGIFNEDQYTCGGSLISRKTVLTAAHCVTQTNTKRSLEVEYIRVYLGIIDISNIDDHFYHTVSEIKVHSDFNPLYYTTDIGLIILTREVAINNYVKPVCLYKRTLDISTLHNQFGKVAGWGINKDGIVNNELNYLDVPVVSQKTCIQTNTYFSTILAHGESFCAGHANGNSVCNGDSGGGLVFSENSTYYIRGIVSVSAQKRNQLLCDPHKFSVFTDVSKFLKWIRKNLL